MTAIAGTWRFGTPARTPSQWHAAARNNWPGVIRNRFEKTPAWMRATDIESRHGKGLGKQVGRESGAGF